MQSLRLLFSGHIVTPPLCAFALMTSEVNLYRTQQDIFSLIMVLVLLAETTQDLLFISI